MRKVMHLFLFLVVSLKVGFVQADSDKLSFLCQEEGEAQNISDFPKPQQIILGLIEKAVNDENAQNSSDTFKQIEAYFDFPRMARFILGRASRTISEDQMQDFIKMFTELQILYFLPKIRSAYLKSEDSCFDFTKTFTKDSKTVVYISFRQSNRPNINLAFYIKEFSADIFKVYDMQIEGVRLLVSWRSEYQSVIRRKGFDELMKLLDNKLLELRN